MNKDNFSFVKWLTNRDIEKVLNAMGIELLDEYYNNNGDKLKPIKKYRDKETGKYRIIVKCQLNEELLDDTNKQMQEFVLPAKLQKVVREILFKTSPLFASLPLPLMNSFSNYFNDSTMILEINDFHICELFSLKSEEEQIKFGRALTKGYQKYMSQKFGRFYNIMKGAAIKKEIAKEKADSEKVKELEK